MIKLLESTYEEGVSCSIIQTDIGNYYGYAFVHPEDEEDASSYAGCEIAEYRATIYYFQEKIRRLNNELNALYQLRTDFIKRLNLENEAVVQLCKRIEQREVQKDIYRTNIADIKKAINDKLNGRIEFLNKIKEKKQDNE
jgi:hypothetical protein